MTEEARKRIRELKKEEQQLVNSGPFSQDDADRQSRINEKIRELSQREGVNPDEVTVETNQDTEQTTSNTSNTSNRETTNNEENRGNTGGEETLSRDEVLDRIEQLEQQESQLAQKDNFGQDDVRKQNYLNRQIESYKNALEENPREVVAKQRDEESGEAIPVTIIDEVNQAQQRIEEQTGVEPDTTITEDGRIQVTPDEDRIRNIQEQEQFFQQQRQREQGILPEGFEPDNRREAAAVAADQFVEQQILRGTEGLSQGIRRREQQARENDGLGQLPFQAAGAASAGFNQFFFETDFTQEELSRRSPVEVESTPNVDNTLVEDFNREREQKSNQYYGSVVGTATNLDDAARTFGGGLARPYTVRNAVTETEGEYNPNFDLGQGITSFGASTAEDAVENPGGVILSTFTGGVAGRTATSAGRTVSSIDASDIAETTDAARRVADPRTGFGRRPLPGEETPDTTVTEDIASFVSGDLGERRMTSQELQQFDVVEGENIPDNPQGIPTTERTRTEVINDFLTNTRQGQLQLERPRTRTRTTEDFDTSGRDLDGSTDVTTPQDRIEIDTETDTVRRAADDFDRPRNNQREFNQPGTGLGTGTGLATGAASALGSPQEFDQGQPQGLDQEFNQEFENEIVQQPEQGQEFFPEQEQSQDFFTEQTETSFDEFTRQPSGITRGNFDRPRIGGGEDDTRIEQAFTEQDTDIGNANQGVFASSVSGIFSGETLTEEEAEEALEQGLTGFETRGIVVENNDNSNENNDGGIGDLL
jgi:hypothetical protein